MDAFSATPLKPTVVLTALISLAGVLPLSAQTRMFSIPLSQYGWDSSPTNMDGRIVHDYFSQISFDFRNSLFVGYPIKASPDLHPRGERANIFRVLSIDTRDGKVSRTLDFEPNQNIASE